MAWGGEFGGSIKMVHVSTYLCALLGCFKDVFQSNIDSGDSQDDDDEPHDNGALDIHDDALVIAYLQACEIPIGLTPKEYDQIVHKAKRFRWEGNSLLWLWTNGRISVLFRPKQCESLV